MSATAYQLTRISATVPLELRDALEESARAYDRSVSAELRMCLRAYLGESVPVLRLTAAGAHEKVAGCRH